MNQGESTDRILPVTRVLAIVVIPFLVTAFLILFVFPDSTERRFAWNVQPTMSAMMLGATYLMGVFFFSSVLFFRRWSQVRAGFLPVTAFASLLGIATILHLDRFNHAHLAFWLWAILYATTPFIVPSVWFLNQRSTSGGPARQALCLPKFAVVIIGLAGISALLVAVLSFLSPEFMISVWPWKLSPLTARITGSEFALFGVFAAVVVFDQQWDSLRLLLRTQLASPIFFLIAVWVSRYDFNWANPMAWVFVANVVGLFVLGIPGLYLFMEWQRKKWQVGHPASADAATQ